MTALVLCGGGSRGAVEVGLYRALVEVGLRIDLVVGTSVGAINGAAIAAGISPGDLARLWKALSRRDVFTLNPQLFWKLIWADSLYDHRPLRRFLERRLPVRTFEELAMPLVVTGTDFQSGQPVYWREGDLLDAIMASVAVPGLFPPQIVGGGQVVDGGISDNVPIDVALAAGADTVVFMLCACCERVDGPVRGLLRILRRAVSIAIDRKYHADIQRYTGGARLIALEPAIDRAIDPLDFTHSDALIECGYVSAMAVLKDRADVAGRDGRKNRRPAGERTEPVAPADPRVTRAADGKLVERLRAADEDAVEELVGRYGGLVYRVAVRITGTATDAEEVTWDVMQTVWQNIAGFRGDAALSSWIYRIAANAAYGKVHARKAPTVPLEDALPRPDPPESNVATSTDWSAFCEDPAVRVELRAVLEEAIAELPADYRTVLVLRDVEGLPNAEVADALGLSTAAVKSRTHRARLALRGRLAGFFNARTA